MKAIFFDDKQFNELHEAWWKFTRKEHFRKSCASTSGVAVCSSTDEPLALAYLYFPSNSKVAILAFVTRNPMISTFQAGKAIKLLVSYAIHISRTFDYHELYTATENKTLQKVFEKSDFIPSGAFSKEFFKEL